MLSINKILLPTDFSEASAGAARQAAALARHFHSEIVLLHVQTVPGYYSAGALDGGFVGFAPDLLAEQQRRELESFMSDELADVPVRRVLLEGDPARRIVQFAHEEQVNLIAMPTHGYGAFRRFILGSVTAKVLHDAECPVWTGVHLEEAAAADSIAIRNVMCAVDLGPHSRQTLCWAARLAAEFDAALALVHATAPLDLNGPGGRYVVPEWRGVLLKYAGDQIEKLQQDVSTHAEVYVESGDTPKVVRVAAEQARADVLVIGRSPSGVSGRLRTNAYAIIRESPCPVVSV